MGFSDTEDENYAIEHEEKIRRRAAEPDSVKPISDHAANSLERIISDGAVDSSAVRDAHGDLEDK